MSAVWAVAEMFDVVPKPGNPVLARSLEDWWQHPRQFGCRAARSGPWCVVAPDWRIWCPSCAARKLEAELRCIYCHDEVDVAIDMTLIYDMKKVVTVMAKAHAQCEIEAAR